jgi:hypothetical protein
MLPSARRMLVRPVSAVALFLVVATIVLTAVASGHARPAEAEMTCRLYSNGVVICSEEVTVEAEEPESSPRRFMPSAG